MTNFLDGYISVFNDMQIPASLAFQMGQAFGAVAVFIIGGFGAVLLMALLIRGPKKGGHDEP